MTRAAHRRSPRPGAASDAAGVAAGLAGLLVLVVGVPLLLARFDAVLLSSIEHLFAAVRGEVARLTSSADNLARQGDVATRPMTPPLQSPVRPPAAIGAPVLLAPWLVVVVLAAWAAWLRLVLAVAVTLGRSHRRRLTLARQSERLSRSSTAHLRRHADATLAMRIAGFVAGPLLMLLASTAGESTAAAAVRPAVVTAAPRSRVEGDHHVSVGVIVTRPADARRRMAATAGSSSSRASRSGAPRRASSVLLELMVGIAAGAAAVVVEEARRVRDRREVTHLRGELEGLTRRLAAVGPAPEPRLLPPVPGSVPPVPGSVFVAVLGPIEVIGVGDGLERAKVLESLAYLVCHRRGVAKQAWAAALWPEQRCTRGSLDTSIWQLRRALGVDAAGLRHLPPTRGGRLMLAPSVQSDLDLFEELVSLGAPDRWRSALELVRGRPFDGLGDPDWLVFDGILARVERMVVVAASSLGAAALEAGDPATASWAAMQGLRAAPYSDDCHSLAVVAARARGAAGEEAIALATWQRMTGGATFTEPATARSRLRLESGDPAA